MKTVTIRGIEPEVADKLKTKAAQTGKSINQLTIELIRFGLGIKSGKKFSREYDDLDDLFGKWSDAEYEAIEMRIGKTRQIDQDLWQ